MFDTVSSKTIRCINALSIQGALFTSLVALSSMQVMADEQAHPLFSAYPQAKLEKYQQWDYAQFALPNTVVSADGQFSTILATGE
ncbi:MAG: hypothetical protein KKF79_12135, partial [Gammaproteobacteria bacterium]|nr:hypothetical protein [Gammaproteobacteria bacterium]